MNKEITIRGALREDLSQLIHLAKQLSETVVVSDFHHAIYAGGLVAFVDEIVIDASCRSMKIGSLLMKHFEHVSVEKDCRIVSLATFGAKTFYEKLGYSSKAGYFKKHLQ